MFAPIYLHLHSAVFAGPSDAAEPLGCDSELPEAARVRLASLGPDSLLKLETPSLGDIIGAMFLIIPDPS